MLYPQSNRFRYSLPLDGFWSFQADPEGVGEREEWWNGLPVGRQIAVPGSWNELFPEHRDYLGDAWHVTEFDVGAPGPDSVLRLRFDSVNYSARVWLNGTEVGAHEGGHLPFEFDISDLARDGRNRLAVLVNNDLRPDRVPPGNASDSPFSSMMSTFPPTNFDFFPYGGIQRPVWVSMLDAVHIVSAGVETGFDRNDDLTGYVNLRAEVAGAAAARLACQVLDADGGMVAEGTCDVKDGTVECRFELPGVRLWSPADPHLYTVAMELRDDEGKARDAYRLETGVRTVEVRDSRILLNGEPIHLKGFGKHEDFPVHGRALNLPLIVKDGELFRWMGANSYRTSHYPYAEEALRYADRTGLLVIDEIPAVGLMFGDNGDRVAGWLEVCKGQLRDLIRRDLNHPSVIMWSVANEPMTADFMARFRGAGANPAFVDAGTDFFAALIDAGRELDRSRPFSLAGVMGGPVEWLELCDAVMVNRYWGWYRLGGQIEQARAEMEEELDVLHERLAKPIIIAEFGADTIAGHHSEPSEMFSEEYQVDVLRMTLDVAAERPWIAGLHVWNFADFKTGQGAMRPASLNHKGVFTRERRPKMAAHFLRSRWREDAAA